MPMNSARPGPFRAWLLAARPKTLAGAATPVVAGCALAASQGCFRWPAALLCLCFALLMQVAANFVNDLYDHLRGSDGADRLGPPRAVAQGWISARAMRRGIALTAAAACVAGLCLLPYGGLRLVPLGALCLLFAFLYTAGPYPLAYHGWGDVLVILFFGFVPVGGTYFVLCHGWSAQVAVASLACGLAVETLLLVNNCRDAEQDARSGKRTIVVRWGRRAGSALYLASGVAAALLCLLFLLWDRSWAALLPQLYLLPHVAAWLRMRAIGSGRGLNAVLGLSARNMLLFGVLLSLGLLL